MLAKILALDPEKKDRILAAARKEFAAKGYEGASTNEIVKEAGISKGLLFHYFESKKELYLYLYEEAVAVFKKELNDKLDWNEPDIFKRWRQVLEFKMATVARYPELLEFLLKTYYDNSEMMQELNKRSRDEFAETYANLLKNIDYSKFRDGVDPKKAIDIIIWTNDGYAARQKEKFAKLPNEKPVYEMMFAEMEMYLDLLQKCFYK